RENVSIQILNGTGIAKEAAYLSGKLEELGYSQIDAGNADSTDYVDTSVTFDETLPEEVIDDIMARLEEIYEEVNSDTSSDLGDYQVKVIIGYKKGYTPTPTPTPTLTPTPEPEEDNVTPTSSPSATPSI
ncbi:MAG: LytR C-terminal domain-containing protein, partial [Patescibacteria group bacterium]